MLTVRGVYDGRSVRPLPSEELPRAHGDVPVLITFLDDEVAGVARSAEAHAARRLRSARERMDPLDFPVKDLVEAGRER